MMEQHQTIFGKGKGNCFATCVGCILDININDVPNLSWISPNWREDTNQWLNQFKLYFVDFELPGDLRDEQVKYWGYHIIFGDSPRGDGVRHSVVGYQGKMIFDPHPDNTGLVGDDFEYGLLVIKI